jgi:hypothetical protein
MPSGTTVPHVEVSLPASVAYDVLLGAPAEMLRP